MEDNDISSCWSMKEVRYLVHHHIFIRIQSWLHARSLYVVALNDKANYEKDQYGEQHCLYNFTRQM